MGIGFSATFLIASLLLITTTSQEPNTDGFYVSDFFQKMGRELPLSTNGFSSPICSWAGVKCDEQMGNVVIALSASGLNLSGPIPENTIGKLAKLQSLDLSSNSITGLSSDFWGLGSSLIILNLSRNEIDGSLSNNIGNFGELESFDLSHNKFSGEIPAAVGSLPRLKLLNLSGNWFEGRIPDEIAGCKSLASVDFSMNKFYGTVPFGFGAGFNSLRSLNLAVNGFDGKMPNLSGLEFISFLNLSGNFFQGSIVEVFELPLVIIDLSDNQFQGHISKVNLRTNYLDLSRNQLSGDFFSDLSQAQSLEHLNLAFNRFTHQNFPQIEKLDQLKYLNLSSTSLVGQISNEISELATLSTLDLSHNHLTGRIPDLDAETLQILDLSSNNLTGEIPLSLQQKLPNLQKFNFSYNNLTFCADRLSPRTVNSSFIGSNDHNNCPIAVNPNLIKPNKTKHKNLKLAVAIALSSFFLILALICIAFGFRKRTRSWAVKQLSYKEEQIVSGPFSFETDSTTWVADVKQATQVPVMIFEKPLLNFTFADLLTATSNFDRGTLLAEGRFGPVYRGILAEGIQVAVKVLVHCSMLTDQEVSIELERLGRIKHPNLVPLTGYCIAGDQRISIYEYMENGNLQNLLHDLPLGVQTSEDWSTDTWEHEEEEEITSEGKTTWRVRHKIALGTARALAFLHHGCFPQIVHRDVKASSIYLDSNMEPRLSDFGLDKVVGSDFDEEHSKGLHGYIPPEFFESGAQSLTSKSDVYGFGVILFELLTGKKPTGDQYHPEENKERSLVSWARALVKKNQGLAAIDPKIRSSGLEKQMEEALRIAYLCTADLPSKRPSMQQIVGLLKDLEPIVGCQLV